MMSFRFVGLVTWCIVTAQSLAQVRAALVEEAGFPNHVERIRESQAKTKAGSWLSERLTEQGVKYDPWPTYYLEARRALDESGNGDAIGLTGISKQCQTDVAAALAALANKQEFALKMVDSNGRQPSGVREGNLAWLGAYDECQGVVAVMKTTSFHGRYCLGQLGMNSPQLQGLKGYLGICVPSSCNNTDASSLIKPVIVKAFGPNVTVDVTCTVPLPLTGGDITAIVVCSILALLMIVGTTLDAVSLYCLTPTEPPPDHVTSGPNGYASVNAVGDTGEVTERSGLLTGVSQKSATDGLLVRVIPGRRSRGIITIVEKILLSFSIITNGRKLFSTPTGSGNLQALNGIRVLSMWWVIQGHTFAFVELFLENMAVIPELMKRFTFQAISNATFSVDSFFFLSGLLVTYLTLNAMREKHGTMSWAIFIFHRFWRLTPALAFTIMIYSTLLHHIPDGPMAQTVLKMDSVTACKTSWWTNLLYINNFYPSYGDIGKQCVGWTWYLANDMQFFLISPLILIPLYRWRMIGLGIIGFLIFTCLLVTSTVARVYQMCANGCPITHHTTDIYARHDIIYTKPFTRIAPYLVGMLTGYLFYLTKCRVKMNKYLVILGWFLAALINVSVLYGLYGLQHGQVFSPDIHALYIGTSRFAWSIGLAWVAFACVTGKGGPVADILSWRVWAPLGRLTYCAYLFHPMVIYFYYINRRHFVHYTNSELSTIFVGNLALSYAVAFIVSMAIEAPMMALEKLVFKRK